jgi:hypothetical protein
MKKELHLLDEQTPMQCTNEANLKETHPVEEEEIETTSVRNIISLWL